MELTPVITWWFVTLIFGLVGWPIAFSLLRFLPDKGFTFVRPVGLLLVGYILWLGASFRLLQNNIGGIIAAMVLVLVVGLLWHRKLVKVGQTPSLWDWLKQEWRYVLLVELLYVVAFIGWAWFKAYNPNIETAGGEKWMEIAFINGILRSDHFPPQDPWLSGFGISYYYFGYVLMAMLTQLTGLVSTVAFNLYVPTLFALTIIGAFGIASNLVQLTIHNSQFAINNLTRLPAIGTGLVSALFVALMGNLIGVFEVLHKRGLLPPGFWAWLDIRDLKVPPAGPGDSWIPDRFIWWWRGSRVLTDYNLAGKEQEVIDEFPFFSFLLGDVHPHVLTLPFVLLVTALALNLFTNQGSGARGQGSDKSANDKPSNIFDKIKEILENSWHAVSQAVGGRLAFVLYTICVGGLSFLNTWDFPIYLGVVGLAFIFGLRQHRPNWSKTLEHGIIGVVMLGVVGIALYLPFYATFQSQARGILPNMWNPTRLPQFLVFFGPFVLAVVTLLFVLARQNRGWQRHIGWTLLLTVLGPLVILLSAIGGLMFSSSGQLFVEGILRNPDVQAAIGASTVDALVRESLWRRLLNPGTFLLLGGLLGWALAQVIGLSDAEDEQNSAVAGPPAEQWLPQKFVLILLLIGLALPLSVEFIFLRDNFGTRMNTIFKFYFQAWVLLALVSAYGVYYISTKLRGAPGFIWQLVMLVLVLGAMIYPVLATLNKTNNFGTEPTLNGIAWVSNSRPGDYAAIGWLRENAPDNAVILEAPGAGYAAYQYTGRVSALTGLPTLLGWGGHQSQWRGNYDEPARREPDIEALFNTTSFEQTQELLDRYGITYVYVGPLERERYSPVGLNKFEQIMTPVFQQDDVVIYQR